MAFDVASPQFGLADVKIATWNSTDSYATEVDVMSVQLLGVTMQTISADLVGDDQITAIASRAISGTCRIRFGGMSINALEVLLGVPATSSIASPNNVKSFRITGGLETPYFGLTGRALSAEDDGDTLIFIPKMRIMGDVTLATLEYGTFSVPELEARIVSDDTYGMINIITRETGSSTVEVPPANIPSS